MTDSALLTSKARRATDRFSRRGIVAELSLERTIVTSIKRPWRNPELQTRAVSPLEASSLLRD